MWVLVSYNRCLYQNGDWREDHFAELENGMLIVYAVSKTASGTMAKVKGVTADELEITIQYEDERGASRSVVLLTGSARSKELWVKYLSKSQANPGSKDVVVFESVAIKSPTKDESKSEASPNPAAVKKRESITGQWDALTSFMGSWQRRLFRVYGNGSVAYHEVVPVAGVSLSSASSMLCIESSPKSLNGQGKEIHGITLSSSSGDVELPKPPTSEPIPPLNQIGRRLSRAVGSFSGTSKGKEETSISPSGQGWNSLVSSVAIGSAEPQRRDEWLQQIQQYAKWFERESLADVSGDRSAKVITKGWGWKKGQMSFSAWKLRYFVLFSNRDLVYYETEVGRERLGVVDLKKKKDVRFAKSADKPQGFEEIIEIETTGRTWYFSPKAINRGEHAALCNHWLQAISDSNENFEKHHPLERSTSFVYSPSSFFIPPANRETKSDDEETLPVITLTSYQKLTGNVPSTMLSPSPSKAELMLHSARSGDSSSRRQSVMDREADSIL